MIRKVIVNIALFFCVITNFILCLNVNSYFGILNNCFNKNIVVTQNIYTLICVTIAFILILIFIAIKLIVQNEKDEIKGIKFKEDDGTYGTANWMSNEEISKILGVIDDEEYRISFKS